MPSANKARIDISESTGEFLITWLRIFISRFFSGSGRPSGLLVGRKGTAGREGVTVTGRKLVGVTLGIVIYYIIVTFWQKLHEILALTHQHNSFLPLPEGKGDSFSLWEKGASFRASG
jgi:hypothetical protein